ncbi:SlyX family protein [Vogesella indigofera]|jgi:SlyX protein|uniref:SlyX family protein n=1 Tax=Vogesella indigofera TaxID=45465 RepID=A0ABT5I869_VOGIN|nr:SlyX family protein [Vogesella indigofera]MDC7692377.1 SlyX family protein [Vogesella indigofera]MDC7705858.1 SlyX family protein [Vogesella indigofera]MDC7708290.1 SlyX family protein [Vogesella indigofera]
MESRLIELEIKVALQEDLLDALNLTVTRQQQQIDLLQEQLRHLYQLQQGASQDDVVGSLRDDIPPHY